MFPITLPYFKEIEFRFKYEDIISFHVGKKGEYIFTFEKQRLVIKNTFDTGYIYRIVKQKI